MVQAGLRDLPSAYIIDGDGVPVIETSADSQLPYIVPPMSALAQAASGQVALLEPSSQHVSRRRRGQARELSRASTST